MRFRLAAVAAITALVVGAATACVPDPGPTPSPTAAFATEEEAFAAAEETYRAYSEAVVARWADSESTPDPQAFLIGPALESDLLGKRRLTEAGIHVEGKSTIVALTRQVATGSVGIDEVRLLSCEDQSATRVIDDSGADVTPADRPTIVAFNVRLTVVGAALRISHLDAGEDSAC